MLVIKTRRSLHSPLTGISCCLPSFNFKPSEDPETPIQCYYEFLAREILADAPAGCELLFLFVFLLIQSPSLSPAGITLGGTILSISRQPGAPSLVQAGAAVPGGPSPA